MPQVDIVIVVVVLCVVVASLLALWGWAAGLLQITEPDPDELKRRHDYQGAIRSCIEWMISYPDWDGEWTLHALLHEYRTGLKYDATAR